MKKCKSTRLYRVRAQGVVDIFLCKDHLYSTAGIVDDYGECRIDRADFVPAEGHVCGYYKGEII